MERRANKHRSKQPSSPPEVKKFEEKSKNDKINVNSSPQPPPKPPEKKTKSTYYISSWLFVRSMGILYTIMFISTWVQIHGLIGEEGISPMGEYMGRLRLMAVAGANAASLSSPSSSIFSQITSILSHPTVFWLNSSDWMIDGVCGVGVIAGMMLSLDMIPLACSILCWLLYLSIINAGQTFFNQPWDQLLCESGFLLIITVPYHTSFSPLSHNPRDHHPPSPALWLYRLLLFRVNFGRGLMQLMGREKTGRLLSSFITFFSTQPSPTPLAWYAEKMPLMMLQGMGFWIITVELAFSLLIAAPLILRRSASIYLILLHLFLIITGNHGSFHWNLILLCLLLLDDNFYPTSLVAFLRRIRWRALKTPNPPPPSRAGRYHQQAAMLVAVGILLLTTVPLSSLSHGAITSPPFLMDLYRNLYPYHLINIYPPMPRMPKERIGITIQGSRDAQTWRDYTFLYSPSPSFSSSPNFVSPHVSRLEYALWSAAQSDYHQEIWISRLLHRMLEDSPAVMSLFKREPFPEVPDYIRAVRYRFQFSDFASSDGLWWRSEFVDIYTPTFSQTVHSLSSRRKNLRARAQ